MGSGGVLTGTARMTREAEEKADRLVRKQQISLKERELDRKRKAFEARIVALRADFEAEEDELKKFIGQAETKEQVLQKDMNALGKVRGKD